MDNAIAVEDWESFSELNFLTYHIIIWICIQNVHTSQRLCQSWLLCKSIRKHIMTQDRDYAVPLEDDELHRLYFDLDAKKFELFRTNEKVS